jgi:hypothetical protein
MSSHMAEIRPAGKQKYPSIDFQQMNPIISNQSAVGACAMCPKTSRRCDRSIPICGRCTEKGLECGGYTERFRFCGLASRGKWKNRDAPSPDVPSPLETRQVKKYGLSYKYKYKYTQHILFPQHIISPPWSASKSWKSCSNIVLDEVSYGPHGTTPRTSQDQPSSPKS